MRVISEWDCRQCWERMPPQTRLTSRLLSSGMESCSSPEGCESKHQLPPAGQQNNLRCIVAGVQGMMPQQAHQKAYKQPAVLRGCALRQCWQAARRGHSHAARRGGCVCDVARHEAGTSRGGEHTASEAVQVIASTGAPAVAHAADAATMGLKQPAALLRQASGSPQTAFRGGPSLDAAAAAASPPRSGAASPAACAVWLAGCRCTGRSGCESNTYNSSTQGSRHGIPANCGTDTREAADASRGS